MVIDVIAMLLVYLVIGIIVVGIFGTNNDIQGTRSVAAGFVGWLITNAIWAAYFIYLWTAQRGTIGMRLLGMQIGHEVDGRTLTTNQAAIRFGVLFGPQIVFGLLAAFVPSLAWLDWLGLAWLIYVLYSISSSQTKQGIHDRYAQSMVVKAARRAG
jgi:uncharacterized RDD family membrane protein YckC